MSYHQPGPYGGQPQQPGPYGQQPQTPPPGYGPPQQAGPHGQQPATPYGPPVPSLPGGGSARRNGIIIGAVVALVATGGGILWFTSGGGSSTVSDDGPHKLTTPATVLGEYKRVGGNQKPEDLSSSDMKDLASTGITDAKSVATMYSTIDLTDPSALDKVDESKAITFAGVFGKVEDPEKAVDAAFASMKNDPDAKITLVGEPQSVEPDSLDGALMKCQDLQAKNEVTGTMGNQAMCIWADYSTLGVVVPAKGGKGVSIEASSEITADLRKEIRVSAT